MSMPFYVPPEQLVKDRAEYARKGIARGKSIVALEYDRGVLLLAENPSNTLHKISEVYDRIAFAGVGKYNEFEAMRVAGIRHADLKGYMYGRTDVLARSLASAFSQTLADIFTHQVKPYEVEILVVELSDDDGPAALYRVLYDGTPADESGFAAIGGQAEALAAKVADGFDPSADLAASIRHAAGAFTAVSEDPIAGWEAAVLEANGKRRTFRRLEQAELETALSDDG